MQPIFTLSLHCVAPAVPEPLLQRVSHHLGAPAHHQKKRGCMLPACPSNSLLPPRSSAGAGGWAGSLGQPGSQRGSAFLLGPSQARKELPHKPLLGAMYSNQHRPACIAAGSLSAPPSSRSQRRSHSNTRSSVHSQTLSVSRCSHSNRSSSSGAGTGNGRLGHSRSLPVLSVVAAAVSSASGGCTRAAGCASVGVSASQMGAAQGARMATPCLALAEAEPAAGSAESGISSQALPESSASVSVQASSAVSQPAPLPAPAQGQAQPQGTDSTDAQPLPAPGPSSKPLSPSNTMGIHSYRLVVAYDGTAYAGGAKGVMRAVVRLDCWWPRQP